MGLNDKENNKKKAAENRTGQRAQEKLAMKKGRPCMQAVRQLASRREFLSGAVAAGIARVLVTSRTASAAAECALLQLSPGVRVGTGTIRNADDAAARAVALAEEAGNRGTFAVGGLLVDNSGRIIAEAINA